jgi:hypothetical protein
MNLFREPSEAMQEVLADRQVRITPVEESSLSVSR